MRKHSKWIAAILVIILVLTSITFAAGTKKKIDVIINELGLLINGKAVKADTITYNGVLYVPAKTVAEALGKELTVDQKKATANIKDKSEEKPKPAATSSETLSQKNAVAKANDYLDFMAFSKKGLVKQLEFDGFSNADAVYAVNKITVDWKEQAVKKGKDYLDIMSFSRSGLIKQLEFDGFTTEEATYAVNKIGL